jgi:hypothetical protein
MSVSEGSSRTNRLVGLFARFPWVKVATIHFVAWSALIPLLRELLLPDTTIDAQGPMILRFVLGLVGVLAILSFPVTWVLEMWVRIMPLGGDMGGWPPNGFIVFCLLIPVNSFVFALAVWYGVKFLKYTLHPDHW